ncbi:FtsX-like permease family protein [Streptomyces sp. YJ-C3]
MTLLDDRERTARAAAPGAAPGPSGWLRDLGLGIRFAASGGREGWIRTLLTAIGVGLGVAVLLGAASVPTFLENRDARLDARMAPEPSAVAASDSTVLQADASSQYRGDTVGGHLLQAEGEHPVLPPGVSRLPGPGEMVVSPALEELLGSPEGKLLKERYDYRVVGTIGDTGLSDPFDLYVYVGSDSLSTDRGAYRLDHFGAKPMSDETSPILILLVVLACVVLLVPVAIFIATAVRFGGERRDRRLAALRLVGADARMTRRIAAGEALFGAVVGLAIGLGVFFAGRQLLAVLQVYRLSAFPGDFVPSPALAVLILLAVPLSAVAVTVFALRSVTIEPLGVVRGGRTRARRVWWRIPVPVVGVLLLLTSDADDTVGRLGMIRLVAGIVLSLTGLIAVLPWLVEVAVRRMRGGPVPWQLATRRLQLSSSGATRAVAGITIAVAGGIALQMFTVGINDDFNRATGQDPSRAQVGASASFPSGELAARMVREFGATEGVKSVIGTVGTTASVVGAKPDADDYVPSVSVDVGDCASLRELARITSCADGDTFRVTGSGDAYSEKELASVARPGARLTVDDGKSYTPGVKDKKPVRWTLPKDTTTVTSRRDPAGNRFSGILTTPGALDPARLHTAVTSAQMVLDESVPDAYDLARNTAFRIDPSMSVWTFRAVARDKEYASIRTGLFTAAAVTMTLIAASMLVSQIEQLRERRRLLSVLVAYGTRRRTLAWSVLWQTAIPVVLGMVLAVAGGLGIGWLMLRMIGKPVSDWLLFLPLAAIGGALIVVVTLLSMPPLWRLMRANGLRTE